MDPGPTWEKIVLGKSSQNSPMVVQVYILIFWGSIPFVFCLYNTLLQVVSRYELNVLSRSVKGFRKSLYRGVGGWDFWNLCSLVNVL